MTFDASIENAPEWENPPPWDRKSGLKSREEEKKKRKEEKDKEKESIAKNRRGAGCQKKLSASRVCKGDLHNRSKLFFAACPSPTIHSFILQNLDLVPFFHKLHSPERDPYFF